MLILLSILLLTALQIHAQTRVKRSVVAAWKEFTVNAQSKDQDTLKSCFAVPLHYFSVGQAADEKTITDISKITINPKFFTFAKTTAPHPSEFSKKVPYLPNGYTDSTGKSINPAAYCKVPKGAELHEVHLSYPDGENQNMEIYLFYLLNDKLVLYAVNNLNQ